MGINIKTENIQVTIIEDENIQNIIKALSPNSKAKIQIEYTESSEGYIEFTARCKGYLILNPNSKISFNDIECDENTFTFKGIFTR